MLSAEKTKMNLKLITRVDLHKSKTLKIPFTENACHTIPYKNVILNLPQNFFCFFFNRKSKHFPTKKILHANFNFFCLHNVVIT